MRIPKRSHQSGSHARIEKPFLILRRSRPGLLADSIRLHRAGLHGEGNLILHQPRGIGRTRGEHRPRYLIHVSRRRIGRKAGMESSRGRGEDRRELIAYGDRRGGGRIPDAPRLRLGRLIPPEAAVHRPLNGKDGSGNLGRRGARKEHRDGKQMAPHEIKQRAGEAGEPART